MKLNIDVSHEIQLFKRLMSWAKPRLKQAAQWVKSHLIIVIPAFIALIVLVGATAFVGYLESEYKLPSQIVFTMIANEKAGDPIPFEMNISGDHPFSYFCEYCGYNSLWAAIQASNILPYFAWAGLNEMPIYPSLIGVIPYYGIRSLTIAGYVDSGLIGYMVMLNDRFEYDPSWNDERSALATYVHELIHIQGGRFIGDNPEEFEARTQAASTEILADMCDKGQDEIACKAFWLDMFQYSKAYVMVTLKELNATWFYEWWDKTFLLSKDEIRAHDSNLRFWSKEQETYDYIVRAYQLGPYLKHIIPGLAYFDMNTGILSAMYMNMDPATRTPIVYFEYYFLQFDDTRYLLGNLIHLLPWDFMKVTP